VNYLTKTPLLKIELYKDPKDETVFYALSTINGETYKIDGVTGIFCSLIDGHKSVKDLLAQICENNQIEYSDYKIEFDTMIESLLNNEVIEFKIN
jgi:hypothetical protein